MNNAPPLSRSPLLMNRDDSALVIIDLQERLLPHIENGGHVVWNVRRLISGAQVLGVPCFATEQYPKGLGPTTPPISELLTDGPAEKTMFSCRECRTIVDQIREQGVTNVVLAGIETHVCVQQTALDFLSFGFNVFIAADAVSSRFPIDRDVALRRMESSGAILTTVEATLFEWCEQAGSDEFKQISKLAREVFSENLEPGPTP